MECACTVPVDFDSDERVKFIGTTSHTARKEHKCNECKEYISPGQWYQKEAFVCEGKFEVHKTCEHCWSLRQVFFSDGWLYGCLWDEMREFINEARGDLSVDCILMLTPKARGKVLDIIEELWEDEEE